MRKGSQGRRIISANVTSWLVQEGLLCLYGDTWYPGLQRRHHLAYKDKQVHRVSRFTQLATEDTCCLFIRHFQTVWHSMETWRLKLKSKQETGSSTLTSHFYFYTTSGKSSHDPHPSLLSLLLNTCLFHISTHLQYIMFTFILWSRYTNLTLISSFYSLSTPQLTPTLDSHPICKKVNLPVSYHISSFDNTYITST